MGYNLYGRSVYAALIVLCFAATLRPQTPSAIKDSLVRNGRGMRMLVTPENTQPALRILLPGHPSTDRAIEVVFPEHVTVRRQGAADAEHIYMWQQGAQGDPPAWRRHGSSLEYERDFADGIHMRARATLEDDGVLFHYEFRNTSSTAFDLIWAPTDPRLTSIFYDVRLERTYVHHKEGWALLAARTPGRLSMPLGEWLPARYLDSFTWPVPAKLVERRADGITYYNNPIPVDQPVVATLSEDHKWAVASFSNTTGNVWSNPELTCQHVDESSTLAPHGDATLEIKLLILRGTLDDVLNKVITQRNGLK